MKKKLYLYAIVIGLSLLTIVVINQLLIYIMPKELPASEQFLWFSRWSSSLSFVSVLLIIAIIYRYISSKKGS